MTSPRSTTSLLRSARRAALVAALAVGGLSVRDQPADACGWSGPEASDLILFEPAVAADPTPPGLQFDPSTAGFGGPCEDCARTAMLTDWNAYLKGAVPADAWTKVLYESTAADLRALARAVIGKGTAPASTPITGWKVKAARAQLERGLAYLALARDVEAIASLEASPGNAADLLARAQAGLKAAKEPFLAQRYALQVIRVRFYQRDFPGVIDFFDKGKAPLAAPSSDVAARARYYLAGALRRTGALARANLELARVHAGSVALAPAAAQDFEPMEDTDWKEALRLAGTPREQAQLWRMVGLKQDGLVAAQEMFKLEPTSTQIALLLVREIHKAEGHLSTAWGDELDVTVRDAEHKRLTAIERLASTISSTAKADRPWLMSLLAGHAAALRGDLTAARGHLDRAIKGRPGDAKVASQAKASLALALARDPKPSPVVEDELARAIAAVDPSFARQGAVTAEVKAALARTYARSGRMIDAEFLRPGTAPASSWKDAAFIQQMIARAGKASTAFDRFVLSGGLTKPNLEQELALRQLLDGKFATAARTFATTTATSTALGTDPFVTHIVDCHDCDHATFAAAPWTHASVAARLAELEKAAAGKGNKAAEAALELGTALYNLTWYGNARVVLDASHQATRDTATAERWYKKAFELATSRELKARAAFYAAKAELMALLTAKHDPYDQVEVLPVPTRWYPVVKSFADTAYYRDVLDECGAFRRWANKPRIK
jgi:hypothetical protein